MHEEITIPELTEVVARVTALLGPREGSVVQLEGGITNRNFRVNFGGDGLRRAPAGQAHGDAGDRPHRRVHRQQGGRRSWAWRPEVAAMFEEPPCLVTMFIDGREMTAGRAARAGRARGDRRATCAASTSPGPELPTGFDSFRLVRGVRGERPRARLASRPRATTRRSRCRDRIEKAVRDQPTHERVPAHNDLLTANFLLDGDRVQLIDWEYAGMGDRWFDLGNFAVNNELDDEQEARAARGLLRRAARRARCRRR